MSSSKKIISKDGHPMFSARKTAARLNCAPDYVSKLCREGKLSGELIEGQWFVVPSSIEEFEAIRITAKQQRSVQLSQERRTEQTSYQIQHGSLLERISLHVKKLSIGAPIGMVLGSALLVGSLVFASALHMPKQNAGNSVAAVSEAQSPFFGLQAPTVAMPIKTGNAFAGATNFLSNAFSLLFGHKTKVASVNEPAQNSTSPQSGEFSAKNSPTSGADAPAYISGKVASAPASRSTVVNNYPIVERVVERQVAVGGVSKAELNGRLEDLYNRLAVQISTLQNPGRESPLQNFYIPGVINNLSNVRENGNTTADDIHAQNITTGTLNVTGGTNIGGSLSAATTTVLKLTVSTDATILGNLSVGSSGLFSAGTTTLSNLSVTGLSTSTFAGPLSVSGTTTLASDLTVGGSSSFVSLVASALSTFTNGLLSLASTTIGNGTQTGGLTVNGGATTTGNAYVEGTLSTTGLSTFWNGLLSLASSTIGNGTQTGGLTVNGGATTTGNAYFGGGLGVGIATSAPGVLQVANNAYFGGNLFVGGNSTVIGNSSSNSLVINSSIKSNLTPDQNIQYDLGSSSFYWRNVYVGNIVANNISAASTTIAGTASQTFTINSDNVSADAEDMDLIFFRGNVVPNALLSWKTIPKRFEFNQALYISNQSGSTTQPTLLLQGVAGQSGNLLQISSSTGQAVFAVASDGSVTIATSTITALTSGTTTLSNLSVTNLSTSTFAGGLQISGLSSFASVIASGLSTFTSGLLSLASTTIGNGTQTGGLTVNGGATTTGNALVQGDLKISKTSSPTTGSVYFGNGTANINYNSSDYTFTGGSLYTAAGRIVSIGNNETIGVGVRYVNGDGTYFMGATHSVTPDLVFTNAGLNERARLTDAGNFGIGTTSPWRTLSVNGNSDLGVNALAGYFTATSTTASSFAGGFTAFASSTIGNGTQTGGLTVNGGATTTGNAYFGGNVITNGNFTVNGNTTLTNATSSAFFATTASSTNLFAQTGSIGTLSAQTFSLAGASTFTGLSTFTNGFLSLASSTIGNGTQTGGLTVNGGATTTGNAYVGGTLNVSAAVSTDGVGVFTVKNNNVEQLSVRRVGVSNLVLVQEGVSTSYSYPFQVGGAGAFTTALAIAGTGGTSPIAFVDKSSSGFTFFNIWGGNIAMGGTQNDPVIMTGTNTTHYAIVGNSLNGGYGQINNSIFEVREAAGTLSKMSIYNLGTTDNSQLTFGNSILIHGGAATDYFSVGIDTADNNSLKFSNGSLLTTNPRMTLTTGGNLGIGTTTPFGKFAISLQNTETYPNNNAFVIASSTATATTTLFSINNAGLITGLNFSLANGTTTNFFATTASSTNLFAQTGSIGSLSAQTFSLAGASTFTGLSTFTNGFLSLASSTIGAGTQTTGLTIFGGATTTGDMLVQGNATTTGISSLGGFLSTASSTVNGAFNISGVTTFASTNTTQPVGFSASVNGTKFIFNNAGPKYIGIGVYGTVGVSSRLGLGYTSSSASQLTEVLSVVDTGNVGVGTTSPLAQLTVATPAGATGSVANLFLIASSTPTATTTLFAVNNQGDVSIVSNNSASSVSTSMTAGFQVTGGGGTFFNVSSSGVSLSRSGTSNTRQLLVGGSSNSTSAGFNNGVEITTNVTTGGAGTYSALKINPTNTTGAVATGGMYLLSAFDGTTASTSRGFYVTAGFGPNASNTGVGSTSPFAKLSVHAQNGDLNTTLFAIGSSTATATTTLFAVDNTGLITGLNFSLANGTTTNFFAATASSTNLFAQTGSIGSFSAQTFSLAGASTFTGLSTFTNGFLSLASSTIGNGNQNGGLTINGGATTTGNAYFAGKIGISSTTPNASLVVGTQASPGSLRISGLNANQGIFADNGSVAGLFSLTRQDTITAGDLSIAAYGGIGFKGGSTAYNNAVSSGFAMYLASTGNVGIGTTSPWAKLSVEGTSSLGNQAIAGFFTATSTTASSFAGGFTAFASTTIGNGTQTGGLTIYGGATTTGFLAITGTTGTTTIASGQGFTVGGTQLAVQQGSGNIGIGTANPDLPLTFAAGAGDKIQLYKTGNNYKFGLGIVDNGGAVYSTKLFYPTYATGGLQIGSISIADGTTFSPHVSVIGTTGNVGIGTTSPWARLSVEGTSSLGNQAIAGYFTATSTTGTSAFAGNFTVSGNTTLANATSSAFFATTASSTNLFAQTGSIGTLSAQTFSLSGASTFTGLSTFANGFLSLASSTIGNGNQNGGLTINGGATTTGNAYFAGNVGIGTTSPNALLDIGTATNNSTNEYGTLRIGLSSAVDGGNNGLYSIGRRNADGFLSFRGWQNNASGYHFSTNTSGTDTERLTILNGGNVGIGTTTPATTLSVTGNGYFTGGIGVGVLNTTANTINVPDTTGAYRVGGNNVLLQTSGYTVLYDGSARQNLFLGGTGDSTNYYRNTTHKFQSVNASTDYMVVTSTGNVGIGTSTPYARLSVTGSDTSNTTAGFVFTDSANAPKAILTNGGQLVMGTTTLYNISQPVLQISDVTGGGNMARFCREGASFFCTFFSTGNGAFAQVNTGGGFFTWFNGGTYSGGSYTGSTQDLVIRGGMVAVGTTTNSTATGGHLQVWGKRGFTDYFQVTNADGGTATPTGDVFKIGGTGLVGIGTTTPAGKLSVEGAQTSGQFLYLNSQSSGFTGDIAKIVGFANSSVYNALNIVDSANNSKFVVRGDGNVGIGSTTPRSKLTVTSGSNGIVNLPAGNWAAEIYNNDDAATSGGLVVGNRWFANASTVLDVGSVYGGGSAWQSYFTVKGGGTVGVGTTSPSSVFSVVGDGYFTGSIRQGTNAAMTVPGYGSILAYNPAASGSSGIWAIGNNGGQGAIGAYDQTSGHIGAYLFSANAYAGIATIDNAGTYTGNPINFTATNVGIGVTTPLQKLAVTGSSAAFVGAGADGIFAITTGTGIATSNKLEFGVVDGSYSWINASTPGTASRSLILNPGGGFIGIGTTSPLTVLHIATGDQSTNRIRFGNTGSGGKTWDIVGGLPGQNNSNFSIFDLNNNATRFTIDSSGNVGIGNISPIAPLVVGTAVTSSGAFGTYGAIISGADQTTAALTASGNHGGSLLLKDSGFLGGNGGALLFGFNSGHDRFFAGIKGLAVDGTTNTIGDLAFSTRNAVADAALTERMRITSGGNVGIGTTTPSALLSVSNTANVNKLFIGNYGTGQGVGAVFQPGGDTVKAVSFLNAAGTEVGSIQTTAGATTYNTTSDRRLKENIAPTTLGLDTLMQLPVHQFSFTSDSQHVMQVGFIAQELRVIFPDAVTTNGDNGEISLGTSTPWAVDYGRVTPLLVKAIQDLNLKVDARTGGLEGATTTTQLLSASSTSPTSGFSSVLNAGVNALGAMVVRVFNGAISATVGVFNKVYAKETHTDKLCVSKLNGTEVCVTGEQLEAAVAGVTTSSTPNGGGNGGGATTTDSIAPTITLIGNNPATIPVGSTYSDLGATVSDNVNDNLGYKVSLDGGPLMDISALTLDTATSTTYTILFSATDAAGNIGTATRTVIVE